MPKDTQIEILYDDLKKVISEKYEKMKGFKIAPMGDINIIDYLELLLFDNIDNFSIVKDIITEWELVTFKNDTEINQIFNKIRILKNKKHSA